MASFTIRPLPLSENQSQQETRKSSEKQNKIANKIEAKGKQTNQEMKNFEPDLYTAPKEVESKLNNKRNETFTC